MSHIIKRKETALLHLKKGFDFHLTRFKGFWDDKEMFFDAVTINSCPDWQARNSKYWENEWCWDTDFVTSIFDTLWSQTSDPEKVDKLYWLGPYLPESITSSSRFLKLALLGNEYLEEYLTGQALDDYLDITLSTLPQQDRLMKVRWLFEKHAQHHSYHKWNIYKLMKKLRTVPDSLLSNWNDCIEFVRQCPYALKFMPSLRDNIDFAIDFHTPDDWHLHSSFSHRLRKITNNKQPRVTLETYKLDKSLSHKDVPVRTGVNKI